MRRREKQSEDEKNQSEYIEIELFALTQHTHSAFVGVAALYSPILISTFTTIYAFFIKLTHRITHLKITFLYSTISLTPIRTMCTPLILFFTFNW